MNEDVLTYKALTDEELLKKWDSHRELIIRFIVNNGYDGEKIYINENAVKSIIAKVDQRRKYFKYFHNIDMSEYKEAALNSFWYIKLHPITTSQRDFTRNAPTKYDSINERMALYIILTTLRAMLKNSHLSTEKLDNLPQSYLYELIYSFTFRDISKEALIMLVESMAVFLGLNPYPKK